MLKPTLEEIRRAQELGIATPEARTGPELRRVIAVAEAALVQARLRNVAYGKFFKACSELGLQIERVERPLPRDIEDMRRVYADLLPAALLEKGIVQGATITMPRYKGIEAGRYRVGDQRTAPTGKLVIYLVGIAKPGGRFHGAMSVWRYATNITPPQQ